MGMQRGSAKLGEPCAALGNDVILINYFSSCGIVWVGFIVHVYRGAVMGMRLLHALFQAGFNKSIKITVQYFLSIGNLNVGT